MKLAWNTMRMSPSVKSIALFTLVAFISTQAFIPAPVSLAKTPDPVVQAPNGGFVIPPELGKIDEIYRVERGTGNGERRNETGGRSTFPVSRHDKTIVLIQDAHDSLEAQENIAKIINLLVKEKGIKTVFEEGYEGPVPTEQFFGFIKDPVVKQKVSYFLLDKLRIGGAEYAHINRKLTDSVEGIGNRKNKDFENLNPKPYPLIADWQLIGVDNLKLYSEDINAYQRASVNRQETEEDLRELFSQITTLANQYFPQELKTWLKAKERFGERKLPLLDYLRQLRQIYFGAFDLTPSPLSSPPERGRGEGEGDMFSEEYPAVALLLAAEASKDPKLVGQLNALDSKVVFEEMMRLEKDVSGAFLKNDRAASKSGALTSAAKSAEPRSRNFERDRRIFAYYQGLDLLRRLNRIEVTQDEYEALRASLELGVGSSEKFSELKSPNSELLNTQKMAEFIVSQTHKSLVLSKSWEQHIQDAVRFYDIARSRDRSLAKALDEYLSEGNGEWGTGNATEQKIQTRETKTLTVSRSPSPDTRTAILVFGGFHANAIKEILKEQGVSYVVISPRITSVDKKHQDYYKQLMSVGHHSFEMPFLVTRASKPPSAYFAATVNGAAVERELQAIASAVTSLGDHSDSHLIEQHLNGLSPGVRSGARYSPRTERSNEAAPVRAEMREEGSEKRFQLSRDLARSEEEAIVAQLIEKGRVVLISENGTPFLFRLYVKKIPGRLSHSPDKESLHNVYRICVYDQDEKVGYFDADPPNLRYGFRTNDEDDISKATRFDYGGAGISVEGRYREYYSGIGTTLSGLMLRILKKSGWSRLELQEIAGEGADFWDQAIPRVNKYGSTESRSAGGDKEVSTATLGRSINLQKDVLPSLYIGARKKQHPTVQRQRDRFIDSIAGQASSDESLKSKVAAFLKTITDFPSTQFRSSIPLEITSGNGQRFRFSIEGKGSDVKVVRIVAEALSPEGEMQKEKIKTLGHFDFTLDTLRNKAYSNLKEPLFGRTSDPTLYSKDFLRPNGLEAFLVTLALYFASVYESQEFVLPTKEAHEWYERLGFVYSAEQNAFVSEFVRAYRVKLPKFSDLPLDRSGAQYSPRTERSSEAAPVRAETRIKKSDIPSSVASNEKDPLRILKKPEGRRLATAWIALYPNSGNAANLPAIGEVVEYLASLSHWNKEMAEEIFKTFPLLQAMHRDFRAATQDMDLSHPGVQARMKLFQPYYTRGNFLDVGTGNNRLPRLVRRENPGMEYVLGVDVEDQRGANDKGQDPFIRMTDPKDIPVPDTFADMVNFTYVLHHVEVDRAKYLQEVWRVLPPGGRIFVLEDTFSRKLPVRYFDETSAGESAKVQRMFDALESDEDRLAFLHFVDAFNHFFVNRSRAPLVAGHYESMETWSRIFTKAGFNILEKKYLGFSRLGSRNPVARGMFVLEKPARIHWSDYSWTGHRIPTDLFTVGQFAAFDLKADGQLASHILLWSVMAGFSGLLLAIGGINFATLALASLNLWGLFKILQAETNRYFSRVKHHNQWRQNSWVTQLNAKAQAPSDPGQASRSEMRDQIKKEIRKSLQSLEAFMETMNRLHHELAARGKGTGILSKLLFEATKKDADLRQRVSDHYGALQKIMRGAKPGGRADVALKVIKNLGVGPMVMISPEVHPFSIAGGMAKVLEGLPQALVKAGGEVSIVTFLFDEAQGNKHTSAKELLRNGIQVNGETVRLEVTGKKVQVLLGPTHNIFTDKIESPASIVTAEVYRARDQGVTLYFLYHPELTNRLYPSASSSGQLRRSILLSRGSLEVIRAFDLDPDFILANDWMAAPALAYLKTDPIPGDLDYRTDEHFYDPETGLVPKLGFVVHNLGRDYQARFFTIENGIDLWPLFRLQGHHYGGLSNREGEDPDHPTRLNLVRGGIVHSHFALTVSPSYAREIQTLEKGGGLHQDFLNKGKIYGISNGIDLPGLRAEYVRLGGGDPGNEDAAPFVEKLPFLKAFALRNVQQKYGLAMRGDAILTSMVGRIADQKGVELVAEAAKKILDRDPRVQLLIGGSIAEGDPSAYALRDAILALQKDPLYRGRVVGKFEFVAYKDALEIFLASALFLIPSKYEPGGLTQIESLAAGTAIVGHQVGGIADTLSEFDAEKGVGDAFFFQEFTSEAFLKAVARGINVISDKNQRKMIVAQAAAATHGWSDKVPSYLAMLRNEAGVFAYDYPHLREEQALLEKVIARPPADADRKRSEVRTPEKIMLLQEKSTLPAMTDNDLAGRTQALNELWRSLANGEEGAGITNRVKKLGSYGFEAFPWWINIPGKWLAQGADYTEQMFVFEGRAFTHVWNQIVRYLESQGIQMETQTLYELLGNMKMHASKGLLLIRIVPDGAKKRIEVVAMDRASSLGPLKLQGLAISGEEQYERFMMKLGGSYQGYGTGLQAIRNNWADFKAEILFGKGTRISLAREIDNRSEMHLNSVNSITSQPPASESRRAEMRQTQAKRLNPQENSWVLRDSKTGAEKGLVYQTPLLPKESRNTETGWRDFNEMVFEFPKLLEHAAKKKLPVVLVIPEQLDGFGPLAEEAPWIEGARTALAWASSYFRFKELGNVDVRVLQLPSGKVPKDTIAIAVKKLLVENIRDEGKTPEIQMEARMFRLEEVLKKAGTQAPDPLLEPRSVALITEAEKKDAAPEMIRPVLPPLPHGKKRVVVTGAAGFIGINLVKRLLASGDQVIALDNMMSAGGELPSIFPNEPGLYFKKWDVSEPFDVEGPVDQVIHLASLASPPDYYGLPLETLRSGLQATRETVELALRNNARFLFTSTSEVYGDAKVHPQAETYEGNVSPFLKRSQYDQSKRGAETLMMLCADRYAEKTPDFRIARLFNTYGPFMRIHDGRVITNFIDRVLTGTPIEIYGNRGITRSFGYVDDTVEGLVKLLGTDKLTLTTPIQERVFNVGNDGEFTLGELADLVNELGEKYLHRKVPVNVVELKDPSDPTRRKPDLTRSRRVLNYSPSISLREGLEKTFRYFLKDRSPVENRSDYQIQQSLRAAETAKQSVLKGEIAAPHKTGLAMTTREADIQIDSKQNRSEMRLAPAVFDLAKRVPEKFWDRPIAIDLIADNTGTLTLHHAQPQSDAIHKGLIKLLSHDGNRLIVNTGDDVSSIVGSQRPLIEHLTKTGVIHRWFVASAGGTIVSSLKENGELSSRSIAMPWPVDMKRRLSRALVNAFYDQVLDRIRAGEVFVEGSTSSIEEARDQALRAIQEKAVNWARIPTGENRNVVTYLLPDLLGREAFIYDSGAKMAIDTVIASRTHPWLDLEFFEAVSEAVKRTMVGTNERIEFTPGLDFLDVSALTKLDGVRTILSQNPVRRENQLLLTATIGDGLNDLPVLNHAFAAPDKPEVDLSVALSHHGAFSLRVREHVLISNGEKMDGAAEVLAWLNQVHGKTVRQLIAEQQAQLHLQMWKLPNDTENRSEVRTGIRRVLVVVPEGERREEVAGLVEKWLREKQKEDQVVEAKTFQEAWGQFQEASRSQKPFDLIVAAISRDGSEERDFSAKVRKLRSTAILGLSKDSRSIIASSIQLKYEDIPRSFTDAMNALDAEMRLIPASIKASDGTHFEARSDLWVSVDDDHFNESGEPDSATIAIRGNGGDAFVDFTKMGYMRLSHEFNGIFNASVAIKVDNGLQELYSGIGTSLMSLAFQVSRETTRASGFFVSASLADEFYASLGMMAVQGGAEEKSFWFPLEPEKMFWYGVEFPPVEIKRKLTADLLVQLPLPYQEAYRAVSDRLGAGKSKAVRGAEESAKLKAEKSLLEDDAPEALKMNSQEVLARLRAIKIWVPFEMAVREVKDRLLRHRLLEKVLTPDEFNGLLAKKALLKEHQERIFRSVFQGEMTAEELQKALNGLEAELPRRAEELARARAAVNPGFGAIFKIAEELNPGFDRALLHQAYLEASGMKDPEHSTTPDHGSFFSLDAENDSVLEELKDFGILGASIAEEALLEKKPAGDDAFLLGKNVWGGSRKWRLSVPSRYRAFMNLYLRQRELVRTAMAGMQGSNESRVSGTQFQVSNLRSGKERSETRAAEAVPAQLMAKVRGEGAETMVRAIRKNVQPAMMFVDAEDLGSRSPAQKQEFLYVAFASKAVRTIVYNDHGQVRDKQWDKFLKSDRVTRTDQDLSRALAVFGKANMPTIHLSKQILPDSGMVRSLGKRVMFFKQHGEKGGTLAVALLWAISGAEKARLAGVSLEKDGFWTVAETLLSGIQRAYESSLVFAIAA